MPYDDYLERSPGFKRPNTGTASKPTFPRPYSVGREFGQRYGNIWETVRDQLRGLRQETGIDPQYLQQPLTESPMQSPMRRHTDPRAFGPAISTTKGDWPKFVRTPETTVGTRDWHGMRPPGLMQPPPRLTAAHSPTAPTQETGAPRSTYARAEGAPYGADLSAQRAPSAQRASLTQRPSAPRSRTNRYLDMYYAGQPTQQKFLKGLPEGQAPIETIRGTKRAYWSPTTTREYATPLEAAFGTTHKEQVERAAGEAKTALEMAKARKRPETKLIAVERGDGSQVVYDSAKGRFMAPDDKSRINPDFRAVEQLLPEFTKRSPEEQDEMFKKMPARQREILLQIINGLV